MWYNGDCDFHMVVIYLSGLRYYNAKEDGSTAVRGVDNGDIVGNDKGSTGTGTEDTIFNDAQACKGSVPTSICMTRQDVCRTEEGIARAIERPAEEDDENELGGHEEAATMNYPEHGADPIREFWEVDFLPACFPQKIPRPPMCAQWGAGGQGHPCGVSQAPTAVQRWEVRDAWASSVRHLQRVP